MENSTANLIATCGVIALVASTNYPRAIGCAVGLMTDEQRVKLLEILTSQESEH
ncbi:TPA: hypothetical protein RQL15_003712 [Vibrio vulnificus]|nr:hypothetical protein [Vibrio vulnificus]